MHLKGHVIAGKSYRPILSRARMTVYSEGRVVLIGNYRSVVNGDARRIDARCLIYKLEEVALRIYGDGVVVKLYGYIALEGIPILRGRGVFTRRARIY